MNPYVNALAAAIYIAGVVLLISAVQQMAGEAKGNLLVPMAMLSLFVLSAAVMGYLFLLRPAQLYLDGARGEAVRFFLTTVAAFAVLTAVVVLAAVVFSGA